MTTSKIRDLALLIAPGFLLACVPWADAADRPDPKMVVEQAIEAQGGRLALEMVGASYVMSKGRYPELEPDAIFTCESYICPPNLLRRNWNFETRGGLVRLGTVLQGNRGWETDGNSDKFEPLPAGYLDQYRNELYLAMVLSLVPLVRENDFVLQLESDAKVKGSPVHVVLVSRKQKPDVHLSFDKTSHLLVKAEYSWLYAESKKQAHFEDFLADYRAFDGLESDRKALAEAKIPIDAASLRDLLQKQILGEKEQARARMLIQSLGAEKFQTRQNAENELIKMGPLVAPLLEAARHSTDPEVSSRAARCLQSLGKRPKSAVLAAALHVYMSLHDARAFDLLLAYLPVTAGDDLLGDEVRSALAGLAFTDQQYKAKLLAAAAGTGTSLKQAMAPMLTGGSLNMDIGFRVYPQQLKMPANWTQLRDGMKTMEWEVKEMRFFHSLPRAMFARP
jgi:hypothetical protein